ncbi:MAG: hypothetical protein QF578_01905 [Alphaproteobacteria bacterium]|jgi:hypothetical protein|nr:hypothetical protein [Alphaproteobacteria bacterium]MDP6815002.1 hypothetical protein [Alphaproteobacteria bacterium]
MADFRLEPKDEYPHPLEAAENFNESVYCNGFDPDLAFGGWLRLGNRANEGHAELSVCLYLPDGRIACRFDRPAIDGNDGFEAGGFHYRVETPLAEIALRYQGEVFVLDDPTGLDDPAKAFAMAPRQDCLVDWRISGTSPLHGGEPTRDDVQTMYGRDFSRNHFNQHTAVRGLIRVGDEQWPLDGFGWRDHSWGPRYWQNIRFYRLLLGNFGPDAGFMLLKITDPGGRTRRVGVFQRDGEYQEIRDLDLLTEWTGRREQRRIELALRTAGGVERISGEVVNLAPLRNRRRVEGREMRTRIAEGFTRWTWRERTGFGMSEYLDLVEDGQPIGYPG